MIPRPFRFTGCVRLARFVAGAVLACAVGNSAHAVLYNWVNTSAGLTGTNSFTLAASFEAPDSALANSAISTAEVSAFSATSIAGAFNSLPSGSFTSLQAGAGYQVNASLNVINGQFRSSATGTAFGGLALYDLLINPTSWQQTIRFTYNGMPQVIAFNGTGSWVPTVTPPPNQNVPEAMSTVGALALACVTLVGLRRRRPADSPIA